MTTATDNQTFSIKEFEKLFRSCEARKYMSRMDVIQINNAIEDKDVELLKVLYGILQSGEKRQNAIVQRFVTTKNQILADYDSNLKTIKKDYVQKPQMVRREKIEAKERESADQILDQINNG